MKIGILETGHPPPELAAEHGSYGQMFARYLAGRGLDFASWPVVDGRFPGAVDEAEGWLLTGSRHGVYEDHAFIPPLLDFIRAAQAARRPIVGICFGHQAVAAALGGRVEKFPGGWSVGPTLYSGRLGPVELNAWHQDQVVAPPPGAETVLTNPFCLHAGLVIDDNALTVQAHPEFDDRFVAGLIEHRGRGVVPAPLLEAASERLGAPGDAGGPAAEATGNRPSPTEAGRTRIAETIADFFHSRRNR